METGEFPLMGNQFVAGGNKYVFKQRKQATVNKPVDYLLQLQPKVEYISSLFPTGEEGLYTFDYKRKVFILKKNEYNVVIVEGG